MSVVVILKKNIKYQDIARGWRCQHPPSKAGSSYLNNINETIGNHIYNSGGEPIIIHIKPKIK